jgi:TonB family protein
MFTFAYRDSNLKQTASFVVSLGLQSAALAFLCSLPYAGMVGPSLRHTATASRSVTPIYFQKEAAAAPAPAPDTADPAPQDPVENKPLAEQSSNAGEETAADSSAGTDSGSDDGHGLVPFPSWRMNAAPTSFSMMHHQIKTALPIFTPDPPILHGKIPEPARGKDVVLEIVINDEGSIAQVTVLQAVGNGVEDEIMQTLRRWIFVPAKVNGYAIASRRQLRFHFPG